MTPSRYVRLHFSFVWFVFRGEVGDLEYADPEQQHLNIDDLLYLKQTSSKFPFVRQVSS